MRMALKTIRVSCAVLAFAVVLYALGYLRPHAPIGFDEQQQVYRAHLPWLHLHIAGAAVALALAPLQLWQRLRSRLPRLHRVAGRVFVVAVLAAAAGGLALAPYAYGGRSNTLGFGLLALTWAGSTVLAVAAARRGDLGRHHEWAIRAVALTFAAVTLRLWLGVLAPIVGFDAAYSVVGWLCWVPNLVGAQLWVRHRRGSREAALIPTGFGRAA
jgi:uncharacterized membrane protein